MNNTGAEKKMYAASSESSKAIAEELALLLSKPDQTSNRNIIEILRERLQSETQFLTRGVTPKHNHNQPAVDTIGIWEATMISEEKHYVRSVKYKADFDLWADVDSFRAVKKNYRIAFLGESVARGYFLEPDFSPAKMLENLLSNTLQQDLEIIDLAKTSMGFLELRRLVTQIPKIAPDAIVVWAGNNWHSEMLEALEESDFRQIRDLLEDQRFSEIKNILEQRMKEQVLLLMNQLSEMGKKINAPVFFVIPDFNLTDWKGNPVEKLFVWPNNVNEFLQLQKKVENCLTHRDLDNAAHYAQTLTKLNLSNPTGHYYLGELALKRNEVEIAKRHFESARDAAIFRTASTPRCFSAMKQAITEGASDIVVIDLPTVFNEFSLGQLPGREIFIDYCHLNVLGIKYVTSAIARSFLEKVKDRHVQLEELVASCMEGPKEVEAIGYLLATIYNVHLGQPYDVAKYHFLKSLQLSPAFIKEVALKLILLLTQRVPKALNLHYKSMKEIPLIKRYEKKVFNPNQMLDADLVDLLADVLDESGENVGLLVEKLRKDNYGFHKTQNLLESFYRYNVFVSPVKHHSYFKSVYHQSRFSFIQASSKNCTLSITYRTPHANEIEKIEILINDKSIGVCSASSVWETRTFIIPNNNDSKYGLNRLLIHWPMIADWRATYSDSESTHMGDYLVNTLNPVYGEIHALRITED